MAWIELHQTVSTNHKVLQLKRLLKMRTSHVVGHLCFLWLWALDNAEDGDLTGIPSEVIAQAADYNPRKAEEFVCALVQSGLLDQDDRGLRIHNWEDYGGRLQESRKRNAERKRRYREKQKSGTGTSEDVPHIHYTTPHDTTLPDSTQHEKEALSSGGGGDGAPGRGDAGVSFARMGPAPEEDLETGMVSSRMGTVPAEDLETGDSALQRAGRSAEDRETEAFLSRRGLLPAESLGADAALIRRSAAFTDSFFPRLAGRRPTEPDYARVFEAVTRLEADGTRREDEKRRELLLYAFQQAAEAGKAGDWRYIGGVLGNLHRRGIGDLNAAEDYDEGR